MYSLSRGRVGELIYENAGASVAIGGALGEVVVSVNPTASPTLRMKQLRVAEGNKEGTFNAKVELSRRQDGASRL